MLTYRLDPLSNPNSPIVCHRTEKTRCMAVRGGKEEPDGGIRRPACERGVDVMGYSCLPSCPGEGKMLGRGTLCTLSLSPLWARGQVPHTHKRMAKIHIFPLPAKSFSSILYFGREF